MVSFSFNSRILLVFFTTLLTAGAFADYTPISLAEAKKLLIGDGSILIESGVHKAYPTRAFKVIGEPKDDSGAKVMKWDVMSGHTNEEILAKVCEYTFPGSGTTFRLSGNYIFMRQKDGKWASLDAQLGRPGQESPNYLNLPKDVESKILKCAAQSSEQTLKETQRKLGETPRLLAILGIEGDRDNLAAFQRRKSFCLEGGLISEVVPEITYSEGSPMEWGTFSMAGCRGTLFQNIAGMMAGKVQPTAIKDSNAEYEIVISVSDENGFKIGPPKALGDTKFIQPSKFKVGSSISRSVYGSSGDQVGSIQWAGDLNRDNLPDFLIYDEDGSGQGCDKTLTFFYSSKDGYKQIKQSMGSCV